MSQIDSSVWFQPHIGPRLSPCVRYVYNHWSGISDKDLPAHLHDIVCELLHPSSALY
jgi:hypothetical protein